MSALRKTAFVFVAAMALIGLGELAAAQPIPPGGPAGGTGGDAAASPDGATSASTNSPSASDGGADAASDAGSQADGAPAARRPLQDEAYIEERRADVKGDLEAAQADMKAIEQRLTAIKKLSVEAQTVRARQATGDAGASEAAERQHALDILRKQAFDLDPALAQTADPEDWSNNLQEAFVEAERKVRAAKRDKAKLETEIQDVRERAKHVRDRLRLAREARCKTAYCFGEEGTQYAFEPMLELPIGTSVSFGGGALSKFNNGTEFTIQFSAGLRFWFAYDMVSISAFIAKPLYSGEVKLRVPGSDYEHPTTSITRVGPSLALGFVGDLLFLGAGYDELRNGSSATSSDTSFPPNEVLSRSITVTFGIAPFAALRNAAGALGGGR